MKTLTVLCLLLFCRLCSVSATGRLGSGSCCGNKGKEAQQSPAQNGDQSGGLENGCDQDGDGGNTELAQSDVSNLQEEDAEQQNPPEPTTPLSFDVSNPDGTNTNLKEQTYSGIEHKQYSPKGGNHVSSVVDAGATLWEENEGEKCTAVNLYYKSDESFLTLWILRGESLDIQHFERVKGKWETIELEEYNKKLNGVPSTPPTETPTSSDSEDPKAAEQETTTVTTEVETLSTPVQRNEDNVDEPENKEDVEATTSQADTQQVPPQVPDTPESRISQKPVNFPNDKTPEQVKDKEVQELNKPARDVSGRSSVTTTGSSPEDAEKPLSSQTTTTLPRSRYTDPSRAPQTRDSGETVTAQGGTSSTVATRTGTNSAVRGSLYGVSEDGVPGSDTDKELLAKALERTDETKQNVYQTGDGYTVKYEYIEDNVRVPEQQQKSTFTKVYRGRYSVTLQNPPPAATKYTTRNYALGRASRNYLDKHGRFVPPTTSSTSTNGLSSRRPSTDSNVGRRVATTDPSGNLVYRSESSAPRNYGVKPPPVEPTKPGAIPRATIERRTISKPLSDVFNKRTVVVDKPVSQDELDTSHDAKDQRGRMIKDKESDYNTSEELEETINFTGSEQNKQTFTKTRRSSTSSMNETQSTNIARRHVGQTNQTRAVATTTRSGRRV
ncbi:signal peptide-containing protein [Theileria equi strain WA]|uniref:Signal peptide-containing protein n=1 Tax=Theileria equi strain WA TaxID=1537102 RepID=L0B0N7_THEEQ|nr:signal peptide-containing protein [Theileria equi strain WA]AFZ80826.1 signal peptide-containing protein [Theileria equi strain WA]|eukprot:XP_004830492.1 signal peptide-containing protein [Theileria equi strain WA]